MYLILKGLTLGIALAPCLIRRFARTKDKNQGKTYYCDPLPMHYKIKNESNE